MLMSKCVQCVLETARSPMGLEGARWGWEEVDLRKGGRVEADLWALKALEGLLL